MNLLLLCNIRFFKDRLLLSMPSDNLEFADSVAVTFEMQKMTINMRQSSMVGQMTQSCAQ